MICSDIETEERVNVLERGDVEVLSAKIVNYLEHHADPLRQQRIRRVADIIQQFRPNNS